MALVRIAHVVVRVPSEHVHYIYLIRLLAYVLIVYAIIDKNRSGARAAQEGGPRKKA